LRRQIFPTIETKEPCCSKPQGTKFRFFGIKEILELNHNISRQNHCEAESRASQKIASSKNKRRDVKMKLKLPKLGTIVSW